MVPTGYAAFPKEVIRPPRSIAETVYGNIQRWTPMAKGGHFAAMEQPDVLATDIAAFFRGLRKDAALLPAAAAQETIERVSLGPAKGIGWYCRADLRARRQSPPISPSTPADGRDTPAGVRQKHTRPPCRPYAPLPRRIQQR